MQEQLDLLYEDYINRMFSESDIWNMIETYVLSSPQIIDVSVPRGNYLKSDYKVVFVGKETNGWFNKREREASGLTIINNQNKKYIEALKQIYRQHNIGEDYRSSIYTFIDLVLDNISPLRKTGFVLTELLRHDYNCGGAPQEYAMRFAFDNNFILRKEIEILHPDALIFLTGPVYDKYITYSYPNIKYNTFKSFDIRQLAIIEGIPGIEKVIRIYHPDAHKYQGEYFRYQMVETITNILTQ